MPAEPARASSPATRPDTSRLGWAWITLCSALALHVTDEALTGFLKVYNPTVLALRSRFAWWPMPTFQFRDWLTGLIVFVCFLFLLTPLFFRGGKPFRPLGWFMAVVIGIGNGVAHTLGSIFGRSVASVHFSRPMPGFWSSPFLIGAAVWVILELRRTRTA